MSGAEILHLGPDRVRVGPWRGAERVGLLAPVLDHRPPTPEAVRRAMEVLRERGYAEAITPALGAADQHPFVDLGFTVHERLHLLVRHLDDLPALAGASRRARRADRDEVLAVDNAAFPPFWRLDQEGLEDARNATPTSRFRVIGDPPVAYAICGRAADRGYVQRLAVRPDQQGHGHGTELVLDGLRWLRRWRVREVLVNTQESNERALALYERLGFRRRRPGLAVLSCPLGEKA